MSVKLMTAIWSDHSNFLTSNEKHVLLKLADCGNDNGDSIYPSILTISKCTSISESTVRRVIHTLIKKKILIKKRRRLRGACTSNSYKINLSYFDKKNPKIDHIKTKKKSVKVGGVLSPRHPNHTTEPSYEPTTVVGFLDSLKMEKIEQENLIRRYGEEYVKEKIEVYKLTKNIEKPLQWFRKAIRHNWQAPLTHAPKLHYTCEDTRKEIAKIDSIKKSDQETANVYLMNLNSFRRCNEQRAHKDAC